MLGDLRGRHGEKKERGRPGKEEKGREENGRGWEERERGEGGGRGGRSDNYNFTTTPLVLIHVTDTLESISSTMKQSSDFMSMHQTVVLIFLTHREMKLQTDEGHTYSKLSSLLKKHLC